MTNVKKVLTSVKSFLLDLFFPPFCLNCGREGGGASYLCEDCQALLPISEDRYCLCKKPVRMFKKGKCKRCQPKKLNGLYFSLPYQNFLVKKLIHQFKYQPYLKELSKNLASLIIKHFQLLDNKPNFYRFTPHHSLNDSMNQKKSTSSGAGFILIPIPLEKKRLKQRGFNQAEEIAKELSYFLKIPLITNCLLKIKATLPQVELSEKEREKNIKGVFLVKNIEKIENQKILLIDDVYTTGSTMEEAARVLKEAGAKEVWGVVVARG